jgi:Cu-Zn family superoxide dismutase
MRHAFVAVILSLAAGASGTAQAPDTTGTTGTPSQASATLRDAEGRSVGEARLQQASNGVLVVLEFTNATPGVHALHIHEVGACDAPSFESAGGHFAPTGREHGILNPRGPHAGDLPNIHVPSDRHLTLEYVIPDVTLDPGPRSLLDADGSAIVMHAGTDDYRTDPAGEAGDRLACGVIVH